MNTTHTLYRSDARDLRFLQDELLHLVVTSPPYWILKKYEDHPQQNGGLSPDQACQNLSEINLAKETRGKWALSFLLDEPYRMKPCKSGQRKTSRRHKLLSQNELKEIVKRLWPASDGARYQVTRSILAAILIGGR